MPVCQCPSWRFVATKKRQGPCWKHHEESFDRKTMETESSEKQTNIGDQIDDGNTLDACFSNVRRKEQPYYSRGTRTTSDTAS